MDGERMDLGGAFEAARTAVRGEPASLDVPRGTRPALDAHTTHRGARPHVVIIGAGFGGLYAARALRRADVRVTVIDRQNYHAFQPLLYQVATATLSPGDIAYPIRSVLGRQRNTQVIMAEATAIDPKNRTVLLRDGEVTYDYLIVAAGAGPAYFGHPEWRRYAAGLKSVDDALAIRRRILLAFERAEREPDEAKRRALLTFVVVGGGPTGVELAGAIGEIACDVMPREFRRVARGDSRTILVEAGPRILPSFPEDLSARAEALLGNFCVEVRKGTAVSAVLSDGVVIGEQRVPAATVLWAAGVKASPVARSLGVELDRAGRVRVNQDLSIPGHPEVFVIGDLAVFTHQSGEPLPGLAPVAIQQGRHAARNILRMTRERRTQAFRYRDRGTLATIGRAAAVARFGRVKFSGLAAWLIWTVVHIFFLIGFRNRVSVLVEWAWAYVALQPSARLITGDGAGLEDARAQDDVEPWRRRSRGGADAG